MLGWPKHSFGAFPSDANELWSQSSRKKYMSERSISLAYRTPLEVGLLFLFVFIFIFFPFILFKLIWLCWVLVAARGPLACGILIPEPGIKPTSPALEDGFLTTGPPGKPLSVLTE